MRNIAYKKSMQEAKKIMQEIADKSHDFEHAKAVARNSILISKKLRYANIDLLKLAAWWHDTGRLYQEDHEKISAKMAKENLLFLGASKEDVQEIYDAIRFHKWNMKPKTLAGKIIRDADKLDFLSISRWKNSKNSNNKYANSISPILPNLRLLLSLEISKKIFDKRIKTFCKETGCEYLK